MKRFLLKQAVRAQMLKERAYSMLHDNDGLSESTEKLLWVLGTVVIVGGAIVWAVSFMDKTALPKIGEKIMDILNLKSGG